MTTTLPAAGVSDAELLDRFVRGPDQSAFAELVRRHGPMVRAVCRRSLGETPDADDAFQAVFVVLARKGSGLRDRGLIGPWLHTVAVRTARRARALAMRRRSRERPVTKLPDMADEPQTEPHDWIPVLDEEIQRLPERFRAPLVLCDLQAVSRTEAAQRLALPEGTLSSRLARARDLLRRRLLRRGVTITAIALTATLTTHDSVSVPAALLAFTTQAAMTGATSIAVATLTEGVLRTMLFAKLKFAAVIVLTIGVSAGLFTAGYQKFEARADDTSAAAEKGKLEGSWEVVSAQFSGKEAEGKEADEIKQHKFVFKGDTVTAKYEVKYAVDPGKKPKEITLEINDGPEQERGTWKGIYELKGDELTICVGMPNTERPHKFETKEGELSMLMKLKRVK